MHSKNTSAVQILGIDKARRAKALDSIAIGYALPQSPRMYADKRRMESGESLGREIIDGMLELPVV